MIAKVTIPAVSIMMRWSGEAEIWDKKKRQTGLLENGNVLLG